MIRKPRLAAEVAVTYVRARWRLRRAGLRAALEELRSPSAGARPPSDGLATGRRLARVVVRTLAVVPADSRCLMRSLVLTGMLARRGIETHLVIAVRPGDRFAAHAWVEHGDVALLPADAPSFEKLVTL